MSEHTAAGHALGFLYQFDRATYHLMSASADVVAVGVEDIDDVSIHHENGEVGREQLKSTIRDQYQLTDSSVALWKTLSIWCEDFDLHPEVEDNTYYCFVVTGAVSPGSFASKINSQKGDLAKELRRLAKDVREDLQKFAQTVLKISKASLAKILARTSVSDAQSPQFGGDIDEVQLLRPYPLKEHREAIFFRASGWVRGQVRRRAEKALPTRISRKEFDRELAAIVGSLASTPLAVLEPSPPTIAPPSMFAQGFVRQLEWINANVREKHSAVCSYLHAQHARQVWAASCAISEAALSKYEVDLIDKWQIEHSKACRLGRHPTPADTGYSCYIELLRTATHLNSEVMSTSFSCGSLNTLADYSGNSIPKIGWHPDYPSLAKGKP